MKFKNEVTEDWTIFGFELGSWIGQRVSISRTTGYYNLSIPHIRQSCRRLVIDDSFVDTNLDLGYTETILHRIHSRHLQIG